MARLGVVLDQSTMEAAVLGGSLLGGGGGGSYADGLALGRLALEMGRPLLVHPDDLPDEAMVVTVSGVGAPAAKDAYLEGMDYVRALEHLRGHLEFPIRAVVTSENGGFSTVNGWLQSAVLGVPVLDSPCNGRAHPTGAMGAMGLQNVDGYVARQAAIGGDKTMGQRVDLYVESTLDVAARLVRQAAVEAGGLVAVARNPVSVAYVKQNAAVGALSQAISVGKAMLDASGRDGHAAGEAALQVLGGGRLVTQGIVSGYSLVTENGFDHGRVTVDASGGFYELTFWNEYMTLESPSGERLGTFPDLLATISVQSGLPVSSAELREGLEVVIVHVPAVHMILGAGMRDAKLFLPVEQILGKSVIEYAFGPETAA